MRGERLRAGDAELLVNGSCPHARGTRIPRDPPRPKIRFISAYAGNARMWGTARPPRTVHPRMRGERGQLPASLTCWGGSSPHARGTRAGDPPSPRAGRFIPACAGNARVIEAFSCSVSVHPRMRGERSFDNSAALARIGSSPHTRGTRVKIVIISSFARFIPAYAGNAASAVS